MAAAAAVRALAEGNALCYQVTTLNRTTGQFETETITRPGPTGLITTSTHSLRPPLTTRLLQVPVAGDADATREVHRYSRHCSYSKQLERRSSFCGLGATIITSQLDPKDWHPVIGDETVADAICDRLVHGAHRIKLTGESLRKGLTNGTKPAK